MGFTYNHAASLIVVVDDDEANLFTFRNNFRDEYRIVTFRDPLAADVYIREHGCDVLISDQRMPGMTGIELISRALEPDPHLVCLLFSAYTDIDLLKECVNSNLVHRFLEKPLDFERVRFELGRAVERRGLQLENVHYRKLLELENIYLKQEIDDRLSPIIGADGDLKPLLDKAKKVAVYDSAVMITGETGTGKELFARSIHNNSPRKEKPFIPVVCSTFSEGVLESELFGHEKGAFTGAHEKRIGRFEAADGGTLFLDEIGDVSLEIQKKLLRVLQEKKFERVGGNTMIEVDVRILSATNRNLEVLMSKGKFREDLFYRLNVVPFHLPPLRKRRQDLGKLIDYYFDVCKKRFGSTVTGISPEAEMLLMSYHWPGNIRELANVFERAMITAIGDELEPEDLAIRTVSGSMVGKKRLGKEMLEELLEEHGGNKSSVARACGISRQYLHRKLKEFGIK